MFYSAKGHVLCGKRVYIAKNLILISFAVTFNNSFKKLVNMGL